MNEELPAILNKIKKELKFFLITAISYFLAVVLRVPLTLGIKRVSRKELRRLLGQKLKSKVVVYGNLYALIILLALFIILVIFVKILTDHQLLNISFDQESLKSIISSLLMIPLTIVGLLIPFFALAAQIALTNKISQFGIQNSLKNLVIFSLFSSGILVFILVVVHSTFTFFNQKDIEFFINSYSFFIVIFSYILVTILISWAGFAVIQIIKLFDEAKATLLLRDKIVKESMHWLKEEMRSNLSFSILQEIFKKEDPVNFSYFQPTGGILVKSKKIGYVIDIKLLGLKFLNNLLKRKDWGQNPKIKIIKNDYHINEYNQQIAAIEGVDDSRLIRLIDIIIKASIRIKSSPSKPPPLETNDPLLTVLSAYKERVINLLKSDNDNLIMQALNTYGAFFDSYMDLGIKIKAEDSPSILGDWRPVTLMLHDLNEVIRASVSEKNNDSIGTIAHWVYGYLQRSLRNENEYIFSRLLSMMRSMYYYSLKNGNEIGANRSHKVPLDVLDYSILRFGKTQKITLENAKFRKKATHLIVKHFNFLLKTSIELNNIEKIKEILSILSPSELFDRTSIKLPYKKYELLAQLGRVGLAKDEEEIIREKINICEIIEGIPTSYNKEYKKIIFSSLSYLIERLNYNDINSIEHQDTIVLLWSKTADLTGTFEWLEAQNIADRYYESIWEYIPKTRGVFTKDPMLVSLTLLSLKLVELQKNSEDLIELPPSRIINNYKGRILELIDSVIKNPDLKIVIGKVDVSIRKKIKEGIEKANLEYQKNVEQSIIDADISTDKVKALKKEFEEGYIDSGSAISILNKGLEFSQNSIKEFSKIVSIKIYQDKEAVIDQNRISYLDWGSQIGSALANKADKFIFNEIKSLDKKQEIISSNLPEAIDSYLKTHESSDRDKLKMFMPFYINIRKDLWTSKKFKAALQLEERESSFFGEYDGLSVYNSGAREVNYSIIGNGELLNIIELNKEFLVRKLSTSEIQSILAKDSDATERKLKQKIHIEASVEIKLQVHSSFMPYIINFEQHDD